MAPEPTGSTAWANTIGMVRVACSSVDERRSRPGHDRVGAQCDHLRRILAQARGIAPAPTVLDAQIATDLPARFLQSLRECRDVGLEAARRRRCASTRRSAAPARARLRAAAKRQRRRAAEHRDELPPPHSMTSSARASSGRGHFEAERVRGVPVDYQLELAGVLHREVTRLFATEDAMHVACRHVETHRRGRDRSTSSRRRSQKACFGRSRANGTAPPDQVSAFGGLE